MSSQEYHILNSKLKALSTKVDELYSLMNTKESVRSADIREDGIRSEFNDIYQELNNLSMKLNTISLPETSRLYFTAQEVNLIKQLLADLRAKKVEIDNTLAYVLSKAKYLTATQ